MRGITSNTFGPWIRTSDPQFTAQLNLMAGIAHRARHGLEVPSSSLSMASDREKALTAQMARSRVWFAEIDAAGGTAGWYTGHEVVVDAFSGAWFTKNGRVWDGTTSGGNLPDLLELNLQEGVILGSIVPVRLMLNDAGHPIWWFDGQGECVTTSSSESSSSSSESSSSEAVIPEVCFGDGTCPRYYKIENYTPTFFTLCPTCIYAGSGDEWEGKFGHFTAPSCGSPYVGAALINEHMLDREHTRMWLEPGEYWAVTVWCYEDDIPSLYAEIWTGRKYFGYCPDGVYTRVSGCDSGLANLTLISYVP